ncbi:PIG-L deacetylase family protein [Roseitranquillus sediminis]|uniref:PIG-L deacetylase family protein n=1 Tax=Roseitranquillus sediminis TaxID=2809051 RepID=UPI001D0C92A5|nr:PIG-L deacetylase family protein [Roseitranquillus sediminis]MBM9596240.1 PIG-L family deacetylase [Roseitranquillus sediminis]
MDARTLLADRLALAVVAPHPDDETLGCGSLLHDAWVAGIDCTVVCVTDGSRSHPNSPTWSQERLADTRRREIEAAVEILAPDASVRHLGYRDCETPTRPPEADEAVARLRATLPPGALVLAAWERDPHVDHQRCAALVRRALARRADLALLWYPIWGRFSEATPGPAVRLAASEAARQAKRRALACHRTQMADLISDDPGGFVMQAEHQAHFLDHPEIFIAE